MSAVLVLRVCGPWRARDEVEAVLGPGWGFDLGDPDATLADVGAHGSVVRVRSEPYGPEEAARVAHQLLDAGVALIEAGGIAVVGEVGVHAPERWRELAERAAAGAAALQRAEDAREAVEARVAFWRALWEAWVHSPVVHGADVRTRGMHALGRPDAVVALDDLVAEGEEALAEAAGLLEPFAVLLLAKAADDLEGQRFGLGRDALQYTLVRETSGPWENPWGYWRLSRG